MKLIIILLILCFSFSFRIRKHSQAKQAKTVMLSSACPPTNFFDPNTGKCQKCSAHCYFCTGKAFYECKTCEVNSVHLASGCVQAFSIRIKSIAILPQFILEYENKAKQIFKPYIWAQIWDEDSNSNDNSAGRSVQ